MNGRWVEAPVFELFEAFASKLGALPLVAEDLGVITPDVREAMQRLELPGMAVLQFAFGDDARNPFLPHNLDAARAAYLGTHDNDTSLGWLANEVDSALLARIRAYIGTDATGHELVWALLRTLLASKAGLAVVTVPDLLGLDGHARMNRPGRLVGNWGWRLDEGELRAGPFARLAELAKLYGRA
jgi:4-alpha-glucanotransferase